MRRKDIFCPGTTVSGFLYLDEALESVGMARTDMARIGMAHVVKVNADMDRGIRRRRYG